MRKKSLLIILLTIVITFFNLNTVKALEISSNPTNRSGEKHSYNSKEERAEEVVYDIEKMEINETKISFTGWAFLHYHNNYGGRVTAIGIKVYDVNNSSNVLEVMNSTYGANNFYKTMRDTSSGEYEENRSSNPCSSIRGSCLYRNMNFTISFNLDTIKNKFDDKEIGFKIVVYYNTDNDGTANSTILNGGVNGSLNSYVEREIGVDTSACKYNGQNCPAGSSNSDTTTIHKINGEFDLTITNVAKTIKVTATRGYIRNYEGDSSGVTLSGNHHPVFYCGNSGEEEPIIHFISSEIINFSDGATQRLYKVQYGGYITGSSCTGSSKSAKVYSSGSYEGYIPASFVNPTSVLRIKVKGVKVCRQPNQGHDLTCAQPEKIFENYTASNNGDCTKTFSTEDGRVDVSFKQRGVLKVLLQNTYIKSGQAFSIGATYTDTISWTFASNYEFSDGLSEDQKNTVKQKLISSIKAYLTESELFNNSSAKFKLETKDLKGLWSTEKNANTYGNEFVANAMNYGMGQGNTITVKAKYELLDAWTNVNQSNSSGMQHKYTNDNPNTNKDEPTWINNGKIYYTDLDLASGNYKITGEIKGLSALAYEKENKTIWYAKYKCGITCYQGYYNKDDGNSGSITNSKDGGYRFSYREIDTSDPFPIMSGRSSGSKNKRVGIDNNWYQYAEAIGEKNGETTKELQRSSGLTSIIERLQNTYNQTPQYVVKVDKKTITNVKNYNSNTDYLNQSGYYKLRYSLFLGSTQGTATNKQGVIVTRNINTPNQVGSCGTKRSENLKTTTCFCALTDAAGNCVYDGYINNNKEGGS